MQHYDYYFQELYDLYHRQNDEIQTLKKQIAEMENTLSSMPGRGVENIEYKFDQLKIENLNGTLHIGLSPENLEDIEDLQTLKQAAGKPIIPASTQRTSTEITNYLHRFGPQIIHDISEKHRYPIDQGYASLILQDIEKQFPARIAYHSEQAKEKGNTDDQAMHQYVMKALKKEIADSIENYVKNQRKGNE